MSDTLPASREEPARPSVLERRAFVRYAADHLTAACRSSAHEPGWMATVQDISAGGIGLQLRHRFRPGTPLRVELRRSDGTLLREVQVRVAYAAPARVNGDFIWRVGCAFDTALSNDELQCLLS